MSSEKATPSYPKIDLDQLACEGLRSQDSIVVSEMSNSAVFVLSSVTALLTILLVMIALIALWGLRSLKSSMVDAAIDEAKKKLVGEVSTWLESDNSDIRLKIEGLMNDFAEGSVKKAMRAIFDDDQGLNPDEGDGDDNE